MTEKEFVQKINTGYNHGTSAEEKGFSYLHFMECDPIDHLNTLEKGLLSVITQLESENSLTLRAEAEDIKRILDAYYETLKEAEAKYTKKLDHILWEKILPQVKKTESS